MAPRVVLIGPPAAGKSRVGRRLATRLELPFIDTDAVIVAEHGPIAEIFNTAGEAEFRRLERGAVHEALTKRAVVSLGGGAVLDPETRRELAAAPVVLITISAAAAARRIDNHKRPLITGIQSWQQLVDARSGLYRELADYTVDSSTRPVTKLVEDIAEWIKTTGMDL
ncbi:MAG: shikimate kinase [Microbacteriaceae bacterium]